MTEELKLHKDDRGFLYELLRRDNFNFSQFGQIYIIGDTKRGIIRAWHRHFRFPVTLAFGFKLVLINNPLT